MKRKSASGTVVMSGSSGETNIASPQEAIQALWAELPTHKRVIAKTRNNENIYGTYIKAPDILRRLQEVFGLGYDIDFSDQILQLDSNNALVVVRCEVGVETDRGYRTVSDYGSAKLVDGGRINDQAFKAAATDALKRAVRWLGIGMFQYDNDEPEIMRSSGSAPSRSERNYQKEIAQLMAEKPEMVEAAISTLLELDLYDAEEMTEEEALEHLSRRFKATPKQLLWLFRDKKTAERFLEENEEKGTPPSQFLNTLFAEAKR
ncbi:MAG: Rad52/Rad22 family DNA repair protein [Candidatus Caldarchaeum sp.]